MKRVDIKISFLCNNFCLFCVQGEKRLLYGERDSLEIKRNLEEAKKDCDDVVFTGGEPTAKRDIIELVSFAKSIGYRNIQIQTNGRMFCYGKFCDEIIKAGANEFSPALHGHTAALHDYLTNSPGSFKQTTMGIKNLKVRKALVITNSVITKPNFRHLEELAKLLCSLGVNQYQFAFVHAVGRAGKNFENIVPRKSLIEPYVKKGLDVGIKSGINTMTEAIPYCFMRDYEKYVAERIIPQTKIFDATEIIDDFTITRRSEGKKKGAKCVQCCYYNECEGPWKEYPEFFGWDEFIPIKNRKDTL
ncbi:MAG: radical SAM protein [Candidatus Omnitrophota bacterium]